MENEKYFQALNAAGIDVSGTLARFVNNEALFIKFLKKFFEETNLKELKEKLENNDYEGAGNIAHTLKGVSGNLGINRIFELFSQMVKDLREEEYHQLDSIFGELEKEFANLKEIV